MILLIDSCESSVPDRAGQMVADVAHRHPAGVEADDHLLQPADTARALGHQPRLEGAGTIPWRVQLDLADLAGHRFRGRAVAGVADRPTDPFAMLIAQMLGQLGLQPTLQDRLDHLRQEPALPGQRKPALIDALEDMVEQPGLDHLVDRGPRGPRLLLSDAQRAHTDAVVLRLCHSHSSFQARNLLHRPSDTPAGLGPRHDADGHVSEHQ